MNQQPDKLFREKLHGYRQPATTEAWGRISEKLRRKTRRVYWLRVAATVILLTTSGIFIYPVLRKDTTGPVAHNKTHLKTNKEGGHVSSGAANRPSTGIVDLPANGREEEASDHPAPGTTLRQRHDDAQTARKKTRALPNVQPASAEAAVETILPAIDNENTVAIIDLNFSGDAETSTARVPEQQPSEESESKAKNIKIVFAAEDVNEKYLAKITHREATPEAKETSGFKRLLGKAHDLTSNEDLLGELRQRKNEILAMNFKNAKQRTEND